MIDLRSDTLTRPTPAMRDAMARAQVGDDVYAEDPTVNQLQDRLADMFGVEAALFVPSGTMGNQISIAVHAPAGTEVIVDADAHVFHYENAATSVIARAQLMPIRSDRGAMPLDDVRRAIRPKAYYYPQTVLIAVESTHNRHGGTIPSLEWIRSLKDLATAEGLALHLDGARVWNAIAAGYGQPRDYGALFDSISVCLSKGLGAPVGSVVLGSRVFIEKARRWRKMLGGGLRQSGTLAAACLIALDEIMPILGEDQRRARRFASAIANDARIRLDVDRVESNIVAFQMPGIDDAVVVRECEDRGLRIAPITPGTLRAVWYHEITDAQTDVAAEILLDVVAQNVRA